MKKTTFTERELLNNLDKINLRKNNIKATSKMRDKLLLLLEIDELEKDNIDILENFNNYDYDGQKNKYYYIAEKLCYYSLKTIARGRKIIDKKLSTDDKKVYKYSNSLSNDMAVKLLSKVESSVSYADLVQEIVLKLFEFEKNDCITIDENLQLQGDSEAIKEVFRTVEKTLDRMAVKHYKRLFIPQYDEKGVEVGDTMYNKSMHEHNMSIINYDMHDLQKSLLSGFSDLEKECLHYMLQAKQAINHKYNDVKGEKVQYKFKQFSVRELAELLNISQKVARNTVEKIKYKTALYLLENNPDMTFNNSYIEKLVEKR